MAEANVAPENAQRTTSRSAQFALTLVLVFLLSLLVYRAISPRWSARPTEHHPAAVARQVDLNSAERGELLQIPGVGPGLADAILIHRQERGRFETVEDLTRVKGVKDKTLEKLRPWVRVSEPTPRQESDIIPVLEKLERKPESPPPSAPVSRSGKIQQGEPPINVNTASEADLQRLPGIGKELARRIIEYRNRAPFQMPDDLRSVKGIGAVTLESIRPFIVVK